MPFSGGGAKCLAVQSIHIAQLESCGPFVKHMPAAATVMDSVHSFSHRWVLPLHGEQLGPCVVHAGCICACRVHTCMYSVFVHAQLVYACSVCLFVQGVSVHAELDSSCRVLLCMVQGALNPKPLNPSFVHAG